MNAEFNKYAIFDEDGDKIESTNSNALNEITDYGIEAFYTDLGISIEVNSQECTHTYIVKQYEQHLEIISFYFDK